MYIYYWHCLTEQSYIPSHRRKSTFSLIPLNIYLLPLATLNRYLSRGSNRKFSFTTSFGNIYITRDEVFLVTIPIMDFVIIHWIQWKSFRENSIVSGEGPRGSWPVLVSTTHYLSSYILNDRKQCQSSQINRMEVKLFQHGYTVHWLLVG